MESIFLSIKNKFQNGNFVVVISFQFFFYFVLYSLNVKDREKFVQFLFWEYKICTVNLKKKDSNVKKKNHKHTQVKRDNDQMNVYK